MTEHYSHEFEHVFCCSDITEWMREIFRRRMDSDFEPGITLEGEVKGWVSTPKGDDEAPDSEVDLTDVSILLETGDYLRMELPSGSEDHGAILTHFAPFIVQDAIDKELN